MLLLVWLGCCLSITIFHPDPSVVSCMKLGPLPENVEDCCSVPWANKAGDIFSTFNLSADDAKKFQIVTNKFDQYFVKNHH